MHVYVYMYSLSVVEPKRNTDAMNLSTNFHIDTADLIVYLHIHVLCILDYRTHTHNDEHVAIHYIQEDEYRYANQRTIMNIHSNTSTCMHMCI